MLLTLFCSRTLVYYPKHQIQIYFAERAKDLRLPRVRTEAQLGHAVHAFNYALPVFLSVLSLQSLSVSLSRTHVRVLRVFLLFIPDVCAETFPTLVCPTSSITRSLPTRTEITDNQILVRPRPRRFFGGVGFLRTVRPMHSRAAIFLCPLLPNYHGCAHGCFKAS